MMDLPLGLGVASPDVVLDGVDPRLLSYAEHLGMVHQLLFGKPFIITSGKDGTHVPGSFHPLGRALDGRTVDKDPEELLVFLNIIAFSAPAQGVAVFDERAVHGEPHVHLELHGA
jgi:hypothetical protein